MSLLSSLQLPLVDGKLAQCRWEYRYLPSVCHPILNILNPDMAIIINNFVKDMVDSNANVDNENDIDGDRDGVE